MGEFLEEVGKEVGRHVIREGMKTVAQGAGCMVTLLAMLTGVGALFALVIAICASQAKFIEWG